MNQPPDLSNRPVDTHADLAVWLCGYLRSRGGAVDESDHDAIWALAGAIRDLHNPTTAVVAARETEEN